MRFVKINDNKYIGNEGYSLIKCSDGLFTLFLNNAVAEWATPFKSPKAAEYYLDNHDIESASNKHIKASKADLDWLSEIYASVSFRNKKSAIEAVANNQVICSASNVNDLTQLLDCKLGYSNSSIISTVTAAKDKGKSSREIARNLIRVKSSNVWAVGFKMSNSEPNTGNVYVQFKGSQGGPGDVYEYIDVPVSLYRRLVSAPSKGHMIWKYFRNNFYYRKLSGDRKGKLRNAIN